MSALTPGPRQTTKRVKHPNRGEGDLTFRNGPAFFRDAAGVVTPLISADFGGASSNPPRSWDVIQDPGFGRVECDIITGGENHRRMWHPRFGPLWLVDMPAESEVDGKFIGCLMRVDPDAGSSFEFRWEWVAAGTPALAARQKRSSKIVPSTTEDRCWMTYGTVDGEILAFRRNGSPETHPAPETDDHSRFDKPPKKSKAQGTLL